MPRSRFWAGPASGSTGADRSEEGIWFCTGRPRSAGAAKFIAGFSLRPVYAYGKRSVKKNGLKQKLHNPMKKILLAFAAMSLLSVSALFAEDAKECKKCSGADKDAACTCKEMKGCDASKDKGSCTKSEKDAKPAPAPEKKS